MRAIIVAKIFFSLVQAAYSRFLAMGDHAFQLKRLQFLYKNLPYILYQKSNKKGMVIHTLLIPIWHKLPASVPLNKKSGIKNRPDVLDNEVGDFPFVEFLDIFVQVQAHGLVFPTIRLGKEFVFIDPIPLTDFAYEFWGHRASPHT